MKKTFPKKSLARKSYWASLSPEQRSERASKMVKARHNKMSKEEKTVMSLTMLSSRWKKKYLSTD